MYFKIQNSIAKKKSVVKQFLMNYDPIKVQSLPFLAAKYGL